MDSNYYWYFFLGENIFFKCAIRSFTLENCLSVTNTAPFEKSCKNSFKGGFLPLNWGIWYVLCCRVIHSNNDAISALVFKLR